MKVLLVGGSGMVGTFVTPYLAKHHELRVMDVRPPEHADLVEYVQGSISNPDDLARALDGMDTFVDMVMRNPSAPPLEQTVEDIVNNYEVNTVGVHLLLWTAQRLGIKHGIYISTRTVHNLTPGPDGRPMYFQAEETMPLDSPSVYGLTKGIGERICQYFAAVFGMRIIALRITGPRTRDRVHRGAASADPSGPVRHGRGGSGQRDPGLARGGPGRIGALRRLPHLG